MIRQLLALIALVTGLAAAAAEPAQARMADIETVGQAELRDFACPPGVSTAQLGRAWASNRPEPPRICPRPQIVIIVPPVMLQVDRARE